MPGFPSVALSPPGAAPGTELFSLVAAEELITRRGLRTPFLRMVRDGQTLPKVRFTSGGGVGATIADQVDDAAVAELFRDGTTAVLQGLHRTWAPITDFSHALAAELGHPVQANAYVTPSASQGFSAHYDVHDVFVLQVHGSKEWTIHPPVRPHPLRDESWGERGEEVRRAAEAEPLMRVTLQPGDCLYLPRGFIHAARALGGTTVHLTLGVHTWTTHHVATALGEAALAALAEQEWVRESLGPTATVGETAAVQSDLDRVREALIEAVRRVPDDELAAVLAARARDSMRAEPVAVFADEPAGGRP